MYRYVVINVFGPEPSSTYPVTDLPLHLTLSNTFYSDESPTYFSDRLQKIAADTVCFEVVGKSKQRFGINNDVSVTEIVKTTELQSLHLKILDTFGAAMTLKNPQYAGRNYRPHVTDQPSGSIAVGEVVVIDNLTLIQFDDTSATVCSRHDLRVDDN